MTALWKIFARLPSKQEDAEDYARECYRGGVIAVGWSELGDLNRISSQAELHRLLAKGWWKHAEKGDRTIAQWAGSLWSFRDDIKPGDYVLCPDRESGRYYVGRMKSARAYHEKVTLGGRCDFAHRREVNWIKTLSAREIRSVWPGGRFGGNQTVTEIVKGADRFFKLLGRKSRPFVIRPRLPVRPDMEWGREAEARAMAWLKARGYAPRNVAHLNQGWDITCGEEVFEVKGRKTPATAIRLSQNEWGAAKRLKKRYTVLVFTASTKEALRKAVPVQIPDPSRTESWTPKVTYEYVLAEERA